VKRNPNKRERAQRLRAKLLAKQRWRCVYCDRKVSESAAPNVPHRATLEHILPVSMGGMTTVNNCAVACFECNQQRGNQRVTVPADKLAKAKHAERWATVLIKIRVTT
jgi:5-methylcytosine-specific restriction endonuclease McrA